MEAQLTVWDVIRDSGSGIKQADLQQALLSTPVEEIAKEINSLLIAGKIEIHKRGNVMFYKPVSAEQSAKLKGLSTEEKLIYQLIEAEGNMGLWTRDMMFKSGLKRTQINKTIKSLESRRLIKGVKSIAGRKRRVYMLYNLEPSVKVKGNSFYTPEGEFDDEFVNVLNEQLEKFIAKKVNKANPQIKAYEMEQKGCTTLEEMRTWIQNRSISMVELQPEEIQAIVNTLIYDGKVEEIKRQETVVGEEAYLYKPTRLALPPNGMTEAPCGRCPVFALCHPDGEISPARCPYLKAWLSAEMEW